MPGTCFGKRTLFSPQGSRVRSTRNTANCSPAKYFQAGVKAILVDPALYVYHRCDGIRIAMGPECATLYVSLYMNTRGALSIGWTLNRIVRCSLHIERAQDFRCSIDMCQYTSIVIVGARFIGQQPSPIFKRAISITELKRKSKWLQVL